MELAQTGSLKNLALGAAVAACLGWTFGDAQAKYALKQSGIDVVGAFRITGVLLGLVSGGMFVLVSRKLGLKRHHFAAVGYWKMGLTALFAGALGSQLGFIAGLATDWGMPVVISWSMFGACSALILPPLLWTRNYATKTALNAHDNASDSSPSDPTPATRARVTLPTDRCRRCSQPARSQDALHAECNRQGVLLIGGNMYGGAGDPQRQRIAQDLMNSKGYRCTGCTAIFCESCLYNYAPRHSNGGKGCPTCGGRFALLTH